MNKEVLIDVGTQLVHLRMYPRFDMCHCLVGALQVRDDIQQYQTDCGRSIMASIEKFIRGVWTPTHREFMFPSFVTKTYFLSSLIFLSSHIEFLQFERELIYLCVASMFIYVQIITLFFKQYDPLMSFENLSSGYCLVVGSDAYRRATITNNLTTEQTAALPAALPPLNAMTAIMNTRKDTINNDEQMKGFDGKKRD